MSSPGTPDSHSVSQGCGLKLQEITSARRGCAGLQLPEARLARSHRSAWQRIRDPIPAANVHDQLIATDDGELLLPEVPRTDPMRRRGLDQEQRREPAKVGVCEPRGVSIITPDNGHYDGT